MKCLHQTRPTLEILNLLLIILINFRIFTAAAADDYYAIPNTTHAQDGESNYTLLPPHLLHRRITTTTSCLESSCLLISGEEVKFSDFVELSGYIRNDCHAKLIKIFASRELIIDRDLIETGSESSIIMIAPRWQISGFRKMTLNVKMFLGISKSIIVNESNLIITSNGSAIINLINLENPSEILGNSLLTKNETFHARRKRSVSLNHDETSLLINSFKSFLREKSQNEIEKPNLLNFYNLLENHQTVQSFYSTITLANEFESLENQFYTLKNHVDFLPFYQSLLKRIDEYAQSPKPHENSAEYKTVNSFLYTATLSKIYSLTDTSEPNLIIDISSYLHLISDKFDALNKQQNDLEKEKDEHKKDVERAKQLRQRVQSINKLNEDYKARFENKINEADEFIKTEITTEIDKINIVIGEQIDKLVDETKELQEKVKEEKEKAVERQKEIRRKIALRGVFSFLKILGSVLSFLGPIGMVVGATVGAVTSATETHTLNSTPSGGALTSVSLPPSTYTHLAGIQNSLLTVHDQRIANLYRKLDSISRELEKDREHFIDLLNTISRIRSKLDKLKKEGKYDANKEVEALENELKSSVQNTKTQLLQFPRRKRRGVRTDSTMKIWNRVNTIVHLSSTVLDVVDKRRSDNAELDEAIRAERAADAKYKQLEDYQYQIYESLIPMVKNMESGLNEVAGKLKNKSAVALDINKWRVQSALRDAKLTLRKFTAEFEIEDFLARSVEKLEEAMTTLINIYDRIQNYEEQKHLADYISAISLVGVEKLEIKADTKLKRVYQQLEIAINCNLVINEFNAAVNALKQWLFPFAHLYLEDFSLIRDSGESINAEHDVISKADQQIKDIVGKIKAYKSGIFHRDQFIYKAVFASNYTSSKPFFTWSSEKYKDEIDDLLSGKEISLLADVESSDEDKEAIKFSSLKFLLKTRNVSRQLDLDAKLKGFKMSATHTGNSYFRFKDKVYALNSVSQNMAYSFENDDEGNPAHRNEVYGKITSGDLMLSPYAMWRIRLVKLSDKFSFEDLGGLHFFKDEVFVEMSGRGMYVGKDINGVNFDDFEKYAL